MDCIEYTGFLLWKSLDGWLLYSHHQRRLKKKDTCRQNFLGKQTLWWPVRYLFFSLQFFACLSFFVKLLLCLRSKLSSMNFCVWTLGHKLVVQFWEEMKSLGGGTSMEEVDLSRRHMGYSLVQLLVLSASWSPQLWASSCRILPILWSQRPPCLPGHGGLCLVTMNQNKPFFL